MKAAKRRLSIFAKPRLRRAELKFGKPRFFPYKDLSLLVGSRHCGELNRGLQNLGSSRKGDGFILFALCKKNQKAHQRFANLWTPGTIQSSAGSEFAKFSGGSCRNRFCLQNAGVKALNRCERVAVLQTQDRCFFEKELLYCKLTAASAILKGLLRVSFGAVGDWIFLC